MRASLLVIPRNEQSDLRTQQWHRSEPTIPRRLGMTAIGSGRLVLTEAYPDQARDVTSFM